MTYPTITHTRTEADAVAEAARLAAEPRTLEALKVHALPTTTGIHIVDLDTDAHRKREGVPPMRKTGTVALSEHGSFAAYVSAHALDAVTTLWADRDHGRVIAVLNDHEASPDGEAGWGDHRATLTLRETPSWQAWCGASGKLTPQAAFAEFLEDHAGDVVDPDHARLLEVASSIEATKDVAHKSAVRLDNGEVKVRYEETIEARAGQAGDLTIPTRIELALSPYEGMDPYRVTARFRYRLRDGAMSLGVVLDRPEDVLRAAFADVLDAIEAETGIKPLHGNP